MKIAVVHKQDIDEAPSARDAATERSGTRHDVAALSAKLRLTSRALGCTTSKELCARFAGVNPATAFTPQNAYKWLGGKAMPRVSSVYDDWARMLAHDFSASFISASSYDEFAGALTAQYDLPEAVIAELRPDMPPATPERRGPAPGQCWNSHQLFIGSYLSISPAWSRSEAGKLILGHVEIVDDGQGGLEARYSERLFGRVFLMSGRMVSDGRTAQSALTCDAIGRMYFLGLHAPAPPANIIGGMLAGTVLHDLEARTTASRMLLVRDHSAGQNPMQRSRYAANCGEMLDQEIAMLGYRAATERRTVADRIIAFLEAAGEGGVFDVRPDGLAALAGVLDRLTPD